jgi:hypothetical protein
VQSEPEAEKQGRQTEPKMSRPITKTRNRHGKTFFAAFHFMVLPFSVILMLSLVSKLSWKIESPENKKIMQITLFISTQMLQFKKSEFHGSHKTTKYKKSCRHIDLKVDWATVWTRKQHFWFEANMKKSENHRNLAGEGHLKSQERKHNA